ncbi:MAG: DUF2089 domain-containing protein [Dehalococcoidia bacterium]|nr:DUF2089 domain-containing protein [Dehalococcoidia bacterium]
MARDWTELTHLTSGEEIVVERVRLTRNNVAIEGEFALPPLAQLTAEDQVFVVAFVGTHGSIKDMEQLFGISYPTVKNRLGRLAGKLRMVEVASTPDTALPADVLDLLERGEITATEALERLS